MTGDLERDLRTVLAERAADIRAVPVGLLALDARTREDLVHDVAEVGEVISLGLRAGDVLGAARRRWPLLLAAAVVLAALGSVLALLADSPSHRAVPPAKHPLRTVTRVACSATAPASWRAPLAAATVRIPTLGSDDVVAVTGNGGAVVQQDSDATSSRLRQRLGYVAPGASSVRWLGSFGYTFGNAHGAAIHSFGLDVDTTGNTAIVTVEAGGHQPSVRQVVALDLRSGRRTVLATATSTAKIELQAYGLDGVAYWQVDRPSRAHPKRTVTSIESRSVDGGPTAVVASAGQYDLEKSALGIEWNLDNGPVDRPAGVPAVVARHAAIQSLTGNVFDSYVTDGQVYAWQTLQGDLDWYDPSTGDLVRIPGLLGVPGVSPGQAALYSVAGPLVYYQDKAGTADRMIDVRTGAVIAVPMTGELFGGDGTLVGDAGSLGTVASGDAGLLRVHTADLPPVRC